MQGLCIFCTAACPARRMLGLCLLKNAIRQMGAYLRMGA